MANTNSKRKRGFLGHAKLGATEIAKDVAKTLIGASGATAVSRAVGHLSTKQGRENLKRGIKKAVSAPTTFHRRAPGESLQSRAERNIRENPRALRSNAELDAMDRAAAQKRARKPKSKSPEELKEMRRRRKSK